MLYIWRDKGQLSDDPGSSVIFEWTVHPLSLGGWRSVIFVVTLILVPFGVMEVFQHIGCTG